MLKILQARLQQYVDHELPDVHDGFTKGRGTRDKLPTSAGSSEKQESFRETSISALLTRPKHLTVWIIVTNCGKFWKRREYQTTWRAFWEICMQVKKQQLELDKEQQTVQIRKGVHQVCVLSPCFLNLYAEYIMCNAELESTWTQDCWEKY